MRPALPEVPDRASLAAYLADRADRADARVGLLVGRAAGPTPEDFDVVAARSADREYASASVVKLPVLYALYRAHDGELSALDGTRRIAPENRVGGTGLFHLLDDPEPSLRDLARAMIAVSDNAATNELLDYLGMDAVDAVAGDLGLSRTRLGRKMMRTPEDDGGGAPEGTADPVNTTSPRDCARLFGALLYGDGLSGRARREQLAILGDQTDRSLFPRYVPYDVELAHKTGWLPDAALDAGIVEGFGDPPLFFAVFCDRAANGGDAADLVAEVGDAVFAWLRGGTG